MNQSERHDRVTKLFLAAGKVPPEQRDRFLDEHCPEAEIRREIEAMLTADDRPQGFLQSPVLGRGYNVRWTTSGTTSQADDDQIELPVSAGPPAPRPDHVGSFRILDVLGEGGMGVVYLAEQDQPQRRVALKVLKPGLATKSMLRRFEHEAHILGRLQHPGIAQVFEAGVADAGFGPQPFFAMELVDGRPLTDYADEHELSTQQRLTLFTKVCDAVNHAHQKGVIHRDLKPGNILVDEAGQPKILDFGVARVTDLDVRTTTLNTAVGELIGTIPYMSPEQAAGDPDQLDTRSDVYALGVICYELLSGQLPYDIGRQLVHEAVRTIRERDPKPLSAVDRFFRGDIETIVGKALEKDCERRYQSASDLAADLDRYLNDEPIVARSPSAIYQIRKFARRNRALVGSTAAVTAALLLGLGGTTWQAIVATGQRDRAVAAEVRAERRFDQVHLLANAFIFDIHDEIRDLPGSTAARERVVSIAVEYLDSLVGDDADDRALREDVAEAYFKMGDALGGPWGSHLGDTVGALSSYRKALAIRRALAEDGSADPQVLLDLALIQQRIANIQAVSGQTGQAAESYRQAADVVLQVLDTDPTHRRAHRALAELHRVMGMLDAKTGHTAEAREKLEQAVEIDRKLLDTGQRSVSDIGPLAKSCYELGQVQQVVGQTAEALESFEESIRLTEELCALDPDNSAYRRVLLIGHLMAGDVLNTMGRKENALDHFEIARPIAEARAAADPDDQLAGKDVGFLNERIGYAQLERGRPLEALDSFRRGLEARTVMARRDPDDYVAAQNLAISHLQVAEVQFELGNVTEALRANEFAVGLSEDLARRDPNDTWTLSVLAESLSGLGIALSATGNLDGALAAYERMFQVATKRAMRDPADTGARLGVAAANVKIGSVARELGREDEALNRFTNALQIQIELAESDPASALIQQEVAESYERIGSLLVESGRHAEAVEPLNRCVAHREKIVSTSADDWNAHRDLISVLGMVAAAQEGLAGDGSRSPNDRLALLRTARAIHQRRLELVESVQQKGQLGGTDAELPASITDAIAKIDAEIEALERP